MKLNYRGDNMTFEEKLSQMYNEIADEISGMIPVEWENIYTIAYVTDQGGEVIFNTRIYLEIIIFQKKYLMIYG